VQNVAIYTFSTLIFRLTPDTNLLRAVLIVAGIWIAMILNVVINIVVNGASRFYGPTGACEPVSFISLLNMEAEIFFRVLDN
jgi:hypothetical protein